MPTTVDDILAEAAALPLRDAAYAIWRQRKDFERLEGRQWRPRDVRPPETAGQAMRRIRTELKRERNTAQDGPTFERVKRAYPHADNAEAKQAIAAAVKFDDDCFRYFVNDRGDFWENVVRAVARAAQDHPDYLASTYRDARNWVACNMK